MVVVYVLPQAELGRNGHRKGARCAPHFTYHSGACMTSRKALVIQLCFLPSFWYPPLASKKRWMIKWNKSVRKPLYLHTYPVHINCKVVYIHFLFPFVISDRIRMQDSQIRFDLSIYLRAALLLLDNFDRLDRIFKILYFLPLELWFT